MGSPTPLDPTRCPACGASNQCAQAGTPVEAPCWCYGVKIAPARLQALPAHLRNAQCLCPSCAGVLEQLQGRTNAP
ncbi:cysteine-rich CWC family protein [Pseudomonas typographi]|uniref:cysteine-rich CWC family protein n=1 Tax=Pseudomonas typographi TaxID=2715964 RepID=UPI001689BB13|nr:cysteine-rich CWC family protein [Pseudomonas typographi]